jgi:hypothetical protein
LESAGAHDGLPGADQRGGRERELALCAAAQQRRGDGDSRDPAAFIFEVVDPGRLRARGSGAGEQREASPEKHDGGEDEQEAHSRQLDCYQEYRCHIYLIDRVRVSLSLPN